MTFDEFKTELTAIISKPDDALALLPDFIDKVKIDYEARDAFKAQGETQEAKIRSLQDTNLKLFLQQTQPIMTKDEPQERTSDVIFAEAAEADKED